ncbi:MAG TPA: FKBP-type peptidyl-prolyl cis-trans isomerase [Nocardioidaceae bacterium]|nr:FKBP-type peptidyl-prolyl cis-trans isomerase [Nocardioidaceae bacterium]
MRRRLVALTVVPLLLFATAACGGDSDGGDGGTDTAAAGLEGLEVSGEFGAAPEVTVDEPMSLEEPQSEVLVEGAGNPVVEGEQALLHLYVANGTNGEKALATYDQGVPASFQMSEAQLFKSVVDATVGETVGSRVVVAAPPEDAFGPQGAPQFKLSGEDDVIFVVDIMSVEPTDVLDGPEGQPSEDVPNDLPTVEEKNGEVSGIGYDKAPEKPSKELQVVTLVEGEGPEVRDDSLVTFDYLGQVYGSDQVFDESYSSEPRTFAVGIGGLIKAWDEAIVGAKQGSRLLIIAPPDVAYGEQGSPPNIPANATLTFVVDVLGVDTAS